MANLNNDIADRLTPSVPMEITFAAQPVATGRKFTTLFGHFAAAPGSGLPYQVYPVVNVGNATAAQAEVDALAGAGSQIGHMVAAFINSNALAGRSVFPAFRVVLIPNAVTDFGPTGIGDALLAVQNLRSDMLVSCYPTGDSTNRTSLINFANTLNGIDRNLQGQFGTFATFGSIDSLATQEAYNINSRVALAAALPDSNSALVNTTGDTQTGANANKLINLASVVGVYPGALITATGVTPGTKVLQVLSPSSVLMSAAAGSAHVNEAIAFQNVVSQAPEIIAAAHAGGMMALQLPYIPMQGMTLGGIVPPEIVADRIVIDPNGSSEAALTAGLSPLYVQPGNTVGYIRTRTTFTTLPGPGNIAATAYIDWQDIVALYDFREDMFQVSQNPPFNNNPGGTKASTQIAAFFKDELIRVSQQYEDAGAFQNVKTLAPFFVVKPSTSSPGRFDFKVPEDVIPGLFVIAGNIVAISDLASLAAFTV